MSSSQSAPTGLPVRLSGSIPHEYLAWPLHERAVLLLGRMVDSHADTYAEIITMVPIPNRAADRIRHVTLKMSDVLVVRKRFPELLVLGYVHNHVNNPNPSLTDIVGLPPGWLGGIYHKGSIKWYGPTS